MIISVEVHDPEEFKRGYVVMEKPIIIMTFDDGVQVDLGQIDKFSNAAFVNLMQAIDTRKERQDKSRRGSIVKRLVSRNRNRYTDSRFNLDLSYITNRIIAMGLPGRGFFKLFRNS